MNSKLSKKISTGIMALLIAVFFIPSIACAFGPDNERHGKGSRRDGHRSALGIWRNPQMVQDLGLTEDQVKKIRDADFTSREKSLALKVQLESLQLEMDKAFSGDTIKDAAVLSLAQKISDVKGKMFVQGIESRLLLGNILNADQLEKLKLYKMQQKRKGRSHSRKHISRGNSVEEPTNASGTAN